VNVKGLKGSTHSGVKSMILRKSIFAGLLAVVIAAIVLPMSECVYLNWTVHPGKDEEVSIGFDPMAAVRSPSVWIIAVLVFSLGFYLKYRRLKARQQSSVPN
jgi:hypothetical protein